MAEANEKNIVHIIFTYLFLARRIFGRPWLVELSPMLISLSLTLTLNYWQISPWVYLYNWKMWFLTFSLSFSLSLLRSFWTFDIIFLFFIACLFCFFRRVWSRSLSSVSVVSIIKFWPEIRNIFSTEKKTFWGNASHFKALVLIKIFNWEMFFFNVN